MILLRLAFLPAALLGALYIALSPRFAIRFYHPFLFHPDKYPNGNWEVEEINGIKKEEVFFRSANGKKLHAWHFSAPGADKTIIFNHGNAGNLTTRLATIEALLQTNASVFVYDYQGYGLSEGAPSLSSICDDGRAAYDYLVLERLRPADKILLYGESLGAGVACEISTTRRCAGIILQSGFSSLERIGKEVLPAVRLYPSALYPSPRLDNLSILKRPHPPLLLLHGDNDPVVPINHSRQIFEEALEPKSFTILEGSNHGDTAVLNSEKFRQSLISFLSRV